MSGNPGQIVIRGLENWPTINVRSGPSTNHDLLFKLEKGKFGDAIDAAPDETGKSFQGKVYQWIKLRLPDGRECWARDDLVNLFPGDHTAIGYGLISVETFAFSLTRDTSYPRAPVPAEVEQPVVEDPVEVEQPAETEQPTTPEIESPTVEPAEPQLDVAFVIGGKTSSRVRSGPSTGYAQIIDVSRGTRLTILDVAPQADGSQITQWVQIATEDNQQGWIREDLLSYQGQLAVDKGLIAGLDMYVAPIALPNYWWIRGFVGPQPDHPGWDLGAEQGEPLLAGPKGGQLIRVFRASRPTEDKPSVIDHGISLGDPSIFSDEGWGWGYGHFVIIRYTYDILPVSAQKWMDGKSMTGGAMFAMYAHMHTITKELGKVLAAGESFGTVGTTGNSEAPHVHLEVRASANPNETSWSRMLNGLVTPRVLFKA